MGDRSSRALGVLAVLTSAGLVTACSGIPTSGPVVAGNPVRAQEQTSSMAFNPGAPRSGDDPAGIVYGFLDAMSAYQPGYDIAKEFLTPEAAAAWDPTAGITVHRGTRPTLDVMDDTFVQVALTVSGEVGNDGSYSVEDAGATRAADFEIASTSLFDAPSPTEGQRAGRATAPDRDPVVHLHQAGRDIHRGDAGRALADPHFAGDVQQRVLRRTVLSGALRRSAPEVVDGARDRGKQAGSNPRRDQVVRHRVHVVVARHPGGHVEAECACEKRKRIDDEHRVNRMPFDGSLAAHVRAACKRRT